MSDVEYVRPRTVSEALDALASAQGRGAVVAGGTDILVAMKEGVASPSCLVDLWSVEPSLSFIRETESDIRIGALTTMNVLARSPLLSVNALAVSEAAGSVGARQTRSLATIGGNLAAAVPSCDLGPPLIAMGAVVVCQSVRGTREVPAEDFFVGPKRSALKGDEIIVEVVVPKERSPRWGSVFLKQGRRRAVSLALVNIAVKIVLFDEEDRVAEARIAAGAVAPTPLRARLAESAIQGAGLGEEAVAAAVEAIRREISPISDHRASADYRRHLTGVMLRRALDIAWERALNARVCKREG